MLLEECTLTLKILYLLHNNNVLGRYDDDVLKIHA